MTATMAHVPARLRSFVAARALESCELMGRVVGSTSELEQQAIDREFAAMAEDSEYRELQRAVVQEFDASDWEAWEQGEQVNS